MPYPSPVQTCGSKPWTNQGNEQVPNESASEKGPYQLKEAMAKSVNTYFVQMISDIGLCPVKNQIDKLGVVEGNGNKLPEVPAIALGARGISPLTMATAYAAFASRGMYCTPVAIESVRQQIGEREKSLDVPKSTCSRAMSETTADTVNSLLSGVIDSGTGQQAGLTDRANAGKTGTTDERKNAWFVGYTPNLAGAVWVGSASQQVHMTGINIGGVYYDKVYGGQVPGPIWRDVMTGALAGKDSPSFNLVNIPDPVKDKDKDPGHDDGNNGRHGGNGNGNLTNGNTISGLVSGGATDGGGTVPTPTFSIPEGFIQGNDNSGGDNGGQRN
jgi:membrane peptidoglycan carboxypeptidase